MSRQLVPKNCLLVPGDARRAHSPDFATDAESRFSASDSDADAELPPPADLSTRVSSLFNSDSARTTRRLEALDAQNARAERELREQRDARDALHTRPRKRGRPPTLSRTKRDAAITAREDAEAEATALTHLDSKDKPFFSFFRAWRRIEQHGEHVNLRRAPRALGPTLVAEFNSLSGPMQYYWTHMFELFRLYERQQIPLNPPAANSLAIRTRRDKFLLAFYYLDLDAQKMLVDDWVAERTARAKSQRAYELEECLARRTLAKIKADMLVVVHNIDYVLRENVPPTRWQGAFEGI
jgi:hypothetical protein